MESKYGLLLKNEADRKVLGSLKFYLSLQTNYCTFIALTYVTDAVLDDVCLFCPISLACKRSLYNKVI